jgi:hypothetical protein
MHLNDIRQGTKVADDVLRKYRGAWKKEGMQQEDGLFFDWYRVQQGT